jgi:hypothetical protein
MNALKFTPTLEARLRAFFGAKEKQARQLSAQEDQSVAPEAWRYFEAGKAGDWSAVRDLFEALRPPVDPEEGKNRDAKICLDLVWFPMMETSGAWEQFAGWNEKYLLQFGNDLIQSIPPGSIYFGGTDSGRNVITALSDSHMDGPEFRAGILHRGKFSTGVDASAPLAAQIDFKD